MKKLRFIPIKEWRDNIINQIILSVNKLIDEGGGGSSITLINNLNTTTSGQGALDAHQGYVVKGLIDNKQDKITEVNKLDINLIEGIDNKVDKNSIAPDLVAGNLISRNTDVINSIGNTFRFRTSGGSESISNGSATLEQIGGWSDTNGNNFNATHFKSIGFNHFNPENVFQLRQDRKLNGTLMITSIGSVVGAINVVGCSENSEAGYEFTYKENTVLKEVTEVGYITKSLIPNETNVLYTKLEPDSHRNSKNSYLPVQDGILLFNIERKDGNPVTVEDAKELCVHICWSGYNDGIYEPYEESNEIEISQFIKQIHNDGLYAAGSGENIIKDTITFYEDKIELVKRIDKIDFTQKDFIEQHVNKTVLYDDNTLETVSNYILKSVNSNNIVVSLDDEEFIFVKIISEEVKNYTEWQYTKIISDEGEEPEYETISIFTNTDEPTLEKYIYTLNYPSEFANNPKLTINWKGHQFDSNYKFDYLSDKLVITCKYKEEDLNPSMFYQLAQYVIDIINFPTNFTNVYDVWDFGCEFFYDENYVNELGISKYPSSSVNMSYRYYLLDSIRSILSRNLVDKKPIQYIVELNGYPSGQPIFNNTLANNSNTIFHYHDESNNKDYFYVYYANKYQLINSKLKPNIHYVIDNILTDANILYLNFEDIEENELNFYNEYSFELTTGDSVPTINFPISINGKVITWNSIPSLETNSVHEFSIARGIGLWTVGKETE